MSEREHLTGEPRLTYVGSFDAGITALVLPPEALDRAAEAQAAEAARHIFAIGDPVLKVGGDYSFRGRVVAAFDKLNGSRRYVVENGDAVLHIFSGKQLARTPP